MPNPKPNKWSGILLIAGTALLIIIIVLICKKKKANEVFQVSYFEYLQP